MPKKPIPQNKEDEARRGVYTTNLKSETLMTRLETEISADIAAFARQMNEELYLEEPGADELPQMNQPDAPQGAKQPKEQADPMKLFRAKFLASPKAVIDQMKDRYIVEECGLEDEAIQDYVEQALPGYQRPDPETRQRLLEQKEELSKKLYEQLLYYSVMVKMENDLPREVQALCPLGDYSEKAMKDTLDYYHAFRKGSEVTPAGKMETFARQLYRVGKIDLSKLDPTDPQALIDNLSDVLTVVRVGWEMQRYIPQIKEFGPAFMEDPRVRLFLQKAAAMYELAPVLGNTLQMMTSSVYPEIGPEAFRYYQPGRKITIPDSDFGGQKMVTTTVKEVYGK